MKGKVSRIVWGVILIIVGIGFTGDLFHWWNFDLFFEGWWTLFLIIPAVVSMVRDGINVGNSILGILGLVLLLDRQRILPDGVGLKILFPILLVVAGLALLIGLGRKPKDPNHRMVNVGSLKLDFDAFPEYIAIFSGSDHKNNNKDFKGGKALAIFGGLDIDLSEVSFYEDVTFECVAVFGGISVKAPTFAQVQVTGVPIFGGNSNEAASVQNAPQITFHCVSIFGGCEIL